MEFIQLCKRRNIALLLLYFLYRRFVLFHFFLDSKPTHFSRFSNKKSFIKKYWRLQKLFKKCLRWQLFWNRLFKYGNLECFLTFWHLSSLYTLLPTLWVFANWESCIKSLEKKIKMYHFSLGSNSCMRIYTRRTSSNNSLLHL